LTLYWAVDLHSYFSVMESS